MSGHRLRMRWHHEQDFKDKASRTKEREEDWLWICFWKCVHQCYCNRFGCSAWRWAAVSIGWGVEGDTSNCSLEVLMRGWESLGGSEANSNRIPPLICVCVCVCVCVCACVRACVCVCVCVLDSSWWPVLLLLATWWQLQHHENKKKIKNHHPEYRTSHSPLHFKHWANTRRDS